DGIGQMGMLNQRRQSGLIWRVIQVPAHDKVGEALLHPFVDDGCDSLRLENPPFHPGGIRAATRKVVDHHDQPAAYSCYLDEVLATVPGEYRRGTWNVEDMCCDVRDGEA